MFAVFMHILYKSLIPIWYNLEKSGENKSYSELNFKKLLFSTLSIYKIRTSTLKWDTEL